MAETIKERRQELGMTMEQLGLRLGISSAAVAHVEAGKTYPKATMLRKWMEALEVDSDTLLSLLNL